MIFNVLPKANMKDLLQNLEFKPLSNTLLHFRLSSEITYFLNIPCCYEYHTVKHTWLSVKDKVIPTNIYFDSVIMNTFTNLKPQSLSSSFGLIFFCIKPIQIALWFLLFLGSFHYHSINQLV
ncbi:hypothetical protein QL285_071243 [Trifolium repens]|nr:hypothetical protein QL285_071243 [Trifolium repens]